LNNPSAGETVNPSDCLQVAYISKAHGIKGELKVSPYSGDPGDLLDYKVFVFSREHQKPQTYTIEQCRIHGKYAIVRLSEVGDRTMAEGLVGSTVWVNKSEMPKLDDNEFYWHQMEGSTVLLEDGSALGKVDSFFSTGAHDIMVVKGQGQEYLIPVIDQVVKDLDPEAGTVLVTPTPGLLDVNEKS